MAVVATILIVMILGSLVGCSHQEVIPPPPSHAVVDGSISSARQATAKASAAIDLAQGNADKLAAIPGLSSNAILADLRGDLSATHESLVEASANLATATNALSWYEAASDQAWKGWQTTQAKLKATEDSRAWWRRHCLWTWGIIAGILAAAVGWFILKNGAKAAVIAAKFP